MVIQNSILAPSIAIAEGCPFRVLYPLMLPKEYANGDKYDGWWYNGSSA